MPGRYLLDANTFIEAKRRYYAFDICPGYWAALLAHHESGRLASIDRIRGELLRGGDELTEWVESQVPVALFLSTTDVAVTRQFGQMMAWVQAQPQFMPAAKIEFAEVADGWLAAYAKVYGFKVITHEVANPEARKRVPLPNVCDAFGVICVNTFEMLRSLETQFVWHGS
jgi:predicted nucleic acid-binding protein